MTSPGSRPRFSIVIPTHNRGHLLRLALTSVLRQGVRALCEQDRQNVTHHDRYQDSRRHGLIHHREIAGQFRIEIPIAAPKRAR